MKVKSLFLFISMVMAFTVWGADPNDGGIGGTGRGDAPELEVFETPDVLEGLDIPLPTDDIPDTMGVENVDVFDGDPVPVTTPPQD